LRRARDFGVFTNLAAFVVPSLVAMVAAFLHVRGR
jgi:chromate transport protein ChrA